MAAFGSRLADGDARLFRRLVGHRSPEVDRALWGVSRAADRSLLWLAIAGLLAGFGGRRGRRTAARGVLAIGLASGVVNGPLKFSWRRPRPRVSRFIPRRDLIATPRSSSFPSGHSASAFAFSTAVGSACPALAAPVGAVAAAVAYSRVHTGVHYPGDVLAGAAVGVAAGAVAARLVSVAEDGPAGQGQAASPVDRAVPR